MLPISLSNFLTDRLLIQNFNSEAASIGGWLLKESIEVIGVRNSGGL
jgi:hypothetical protein